MRSLRRRRPVNTDIVGAAIVLVITLIIASVHVYAHRGLYFAPPPVVTISDSAAARRASELQSADMIRIILNGDRKQLRLIDVWPAAPQVMEAAAKAQHIDELLLPCISRAEGPDARMIAFCNPYGLESYGKLIDYSRYDDGFERATMDAAELLAKLIPDDTVNIPALAHRWCPVNERWWSANVGAIYERALVQYQLLQHGGYDGYASTD
jgi:hypothetical protein